MKSKVLILDVDEILPQTLKNLIHHEPLSQTLYTKNPREAHAKARIDRPDYILCLNQKHSRDPQSFKTELSGHYLTKDIPVIWWPQPDDGTAHNSQYALEEIPFKKTISGDPSYQDTDEEIAALEASFEDVPTILNLLKQEFEDKVQKLPCSA
jgi:hypothetical protein